MSNNFSVTCSDGQTFSIKHGSIPANNLGKSFNNYQTKKAKKERDDNDGLVRDAIRAIVIDNESNYAFSLDHIESLEAFFNAMHMSNCFEYTWDFGFCYTIKPKRKFSKYEQTIVNQILQKRSKINLGPR